MERLFERTCFQPSILLGSSWEIITTLHTLPCRFFLNGKKRS